MIWWMLLACLSETTPVDNTWVQVWADEFSGEEGAPPDAEYWVHDTGGDGWGNDQLEFNTDSTDNVYQSGNGKLRITAREEAYGDNAYTSGRIKTQGKFQTGYGRVEARIKTPAGQGLWPAFWMLGTDFEDVGWPSCGEIDILEVVAHDPDTVYGTVHGPGYSGGSSVGGDTTLDVGADEDFHVYRVDVEPEHLTWYVDDEPFFELGPGDVSGMPWVFDGEFFLLLNLAVGGTWPGNPDETTEFPATMYVDWVRVYERAVDYEDDTDA